jgi:hypothetical protein
MVMEKRRCVCFCFLSSCKLRVGVDTDTDTHRVAVAGLRMRVGALRVAHSVGVVLSLKIKITNQIANWTLV